MMKLKERQADIHWPISLAIFIAVFMPAMDLLRGQETFHPVAASEKSPVVIAVPGNAPWTDAGMDVEAGQEISFEAGGTISLQRGNPQADCGPDGYDLRTDQQPLPERNLGALIGKVVISVTVTIDDKTREEKREESAEIFYIGSEGRIAMPAKGRLFLGINENIIGDNAGEFKVTVILSNKEERGGGNDGIYTIGR